MVKNEKCTYKCLFVEVILDSRCILIKTNTKMYLSNKGGYMSANDKILLEIQEARAENSKAGSSKVVGFVGLLIGLVLAFFTTGILSVVGWVLLIAGVLAVFTQMSKESSTKKRIEELKAKLTD
jgi:hypothetical protein